MRNPLIVALSILLSLATLVGGGLWWERVSHRGNLLDWFWAMLLYSGTMNLAVSRAISAGRRWAVAVGGATNLLFWPYLLFLLPLAGANTPRRMLGPWSVYLLWLGAAALATRRGHGTVGLSFDASP
jgi:hypothetical protein